MDMSGQTGRRLSRAGPKTTWIALLISPPPRTCYAGGPTVAKPLAILLRPLAPLLASARTYNAGAFRSDLLAGLTVAVVEIPQAMAYAYIAGVPPQYGIYTSIIQGFVGAIFSSNDHLASGPTNTHA